MEDKKPENLTIYRKKWLTALGGIVGVLFVAFFIGVVVFAYLKTNETELKELKTEIIVTAVGVAICSTIMLVYSALCFNNLRYPCILATDEKGVYDYSGFIHGGFIGWNEIQQITGLGNKVEAFLDLLEDGPSPFVRIELKNYKLTFANRSTLWKIAFFFTGYGSVRIRTLCSTLSRKNTAILLNERLAYYTAHTEN